MSAALLDASKKVDAAKKGGNKSATVAALQTLATCLLDEERPGEAAVTASEALTLAKELKEKLGQASALNTIASAQTSMKGYAPAIEAAKEAISICKEVGDKGKEGACTITLAKVHLAMSKRGDKDAATVAKDAVELYKAAGDKKGEGSALTVMSDAYLIQTRDYDQALKVAKDAAALLKDAGDKSGEALALTAQANALIAKKEHADAEKPAKDALAIFEGVDDKSGKIIASETLERAAYARYEPQPAKLLIERKTGLAILEMSQLATEESLVSALEVLKNMSLDAYVLKGLVVMCEGIEVPQQCVCPLLSTGSFLTGLVSVGVPMQGVFWGFVSGCTWGVMLACDLRFVSHNTIFQLPVRGSPSVLAKLIGASNVVELMMSKGQLTASDMLDINLVQSSLKYPDEAKKAAQELAKRIGGQPNLACRQTLSLMRPNPIEHYTGDNYEGVLMFE